MYDISEYKTYLKFIQNLKIFMAFLYQNYAVLNNNNNNNNKKHLYSAIYQVKPFIGALQWITWLISIKE